MYLSLVSITFFLCCNANANENSFRLAASIYQRKMPTLQNSYSLLKIATCFWFCMMRSLISMLRRSTTCSHLEVCIITHRTDTYVHTHILYLHDSNDCTSDVPVCVCVCVFIGALVQRVRAEADTCLSGQSNQTSPYRRCRSSLSGSENHRD